jgi:hypothetical protein
MKIEIEYGPPTSGAAESFTVESGRLLARIDAFGSHNAAKQFMRAAHRGGRLHLLGEFIDVARSTDDLAVLTFETLSVRDCCIPGLTLTRDAR